MNRTFPRLDMAGSKDMSHKTGRSGRKEMRKINQQQKVLDSKKRAAWWNRESPINGSNRNGSWGAGGGVRRKVRRRVKEPEWQRSLERPHQQGTFYFFLNNSSCHWLATDCLWKTVLGSLLGTSHLVQGYLELHNVISNQIKWFGLLDIWCS